MERIGYNHHAVAVSASSHPVEDFTHFPGHSKPRKLLAGQLGFCAAEVSQWVLNEKPFHHENTVRELFFFFSAAVIEAKCSLAHGQLSYDEFLLLPVMGEAEKMLERL